jgi:hypothetical protein
MSGHFLNDDKTLSRVVVRWWHTRTPGQKAAWRWWIRKMVQLGEQR